jgi:cyanate lyase
MTRAELTEKIIGHKMMTGFKWEDVAKSIGKSKEWTCAAMLGQLSLSKDEVAKAGNAMGINFSPDETALLMSVPYRGSLPTQIPTDPLIYRFYEIVQVYGSTFKSLIEEEFGDGIMSAIDYDMSVVREPNPKGDRVIVTMSGKFLPYKSY